MRFCTISDQYRVFLPTQEVTCMRRLHRFPCHMYFKQFFLRHEFRREKFKSHRTLPFCKMHATRIYFWLNQLSRINPLPTYYTELQAARAHSTTKYTTPFPRFASLHHLASTENFLTLNCYTQFVLQHWKGDGRPHPFEKFMLGAVQSLF